MAKALVIVESPAKAKTINKYLGKNYLVKASLGHIKDLPKRDLAVDVDNGFEPHYELIEGKKKLIQELKQAAKKVDSIYLAADPDREGEAICFHLQEELDGKNGKGAKKSGPKFFRVMFNEITKNGIKKAFEQPGQVNTNLVEAQQARRVLDRLVGYKISPLLWDKVRRGLSAGRVQTVALRLIVEREREIRAFDKREYWTIDVNLGAAKPPSFDARLFKRGDETPEIGNQKASDAVVANLTGAEYAVKSVVTREKRRNPVAPFITSTLQQESARKLRFSVKRTMMLAQRLYEGIELGKEGPEGLITYMRTDSTRVAGEAVDEVRGFVGEKFGAQYLPQTPNIYKSKKEAQDAHEAIRPTSVLNTPEKIERHLSDDEMKLYRLIWMRFVASQMTPAVFETTKVDFDLAGGRYVFRATGSRVLFDGYHVLYHEAHEPEEGKTLEDLPPIPPLAQGDVVTVKQITPNQHFTEPPPRFSEASLVKELERLGIGRPSTYASIISTLKTRWYATAKDRRFAPTPLGETVWQVMKRSFPDVFEVGFTAQMEDELDKVEEGDLAWQQVLGDFWGPFAKALDAVDVQKLIHEVHDLSELHKEKCPTCGSGLVVKSGRFGPFIACARYPECRFTRPLRRDRVPDKPTNEICQECGAPMVIKTGRYGEFLACTRFPACKHTRPVPLGVKCPKCGVGDLAERRTKKGRNFFGCLRYPECDYSTWNRPVPVACPSCGFLGMEEKQTKAKGVSRKCLKCGHELIVEEAAPAESVAT